MHNSENWKLGQLKPFFGTIVKSANEEARGSIQAQLERKREKERGKLYDADKAIKMFFNFRSKNVFRKFDEYNEETHVNLIPNQHNRIYVFVV